MVGDPLLAGLAAQRNFELHGLALHGRHAVRVVVIGRLIGPRHGGGVLAVVDIGRGVASGVGLRGRRRRIAGLVRAVVATGRGVGVAPIAAVVVVGAPVARRRRRVRRPVSSEQSLRQMQARDGLPSASRRRVRAPAVARRVVVRAIASSRVLVLVPRRIHVLAVAVLRSRRVPI
ncbi:hypothetical protein Mapa_016009 [Marchantia paleacea]|nr:hypothetical protein Mapa_016009 [Marchantia paleacea]